jgi:hypothetical protein
MNAIHCFHPAGSFAVQIAVLQFSNSRNESGFKFIVSFNLLLVLIFIGKQNV